MSHNRPIQIYLDSSDYSVLSDKKRETPELLHIKSELIKWSESKLVEFRYSQISINEAAPTKKEDIENAKNRISLIYKLCGKSTLCDPITLIEKELNNSSAERLELSQILKDNGYWFPELDNIAMPNSKINIQEEITKIGLNRKQRRQISKNTSKNLQENMGKLEIETLTKQVPVTASVARLTRKYLAGKVNSDTLKAALADSFSDITLFSNFYETHWNEASSTSSWIRIQGEVLNNSFKNSIHLLNELYNEYQSDEAAKKEFKKEIKKTQKLLEDEFPDLALEKLSKAVNTTNEWKATRDSAPGIYGVFQIFIDKIKKATSEPSKPPQSKPSDLGDLFHCLYLPYVDIFRTDGEMAETIRRGKNSPQTTVVAKLSGLLDAIERMTSERKVCR